MARYKRRPTNIEMLPGLFDSIEQPEPKAPKPAKASPARRKETFDTPQIIEPGKPAETATPEAPPAVAPIKPIKPVDKLRFISFGSGSSGNCSYIGTDHDGILIDAGVDPTRVAASLLRAGIDMSAVGGIILTHDHGDHVRYAYTILRRFRHMRLYCTPKTLNGLLRRHSISRRIKDYHQPVFKEFEFHLGSFTITPFEVSHDGSDNCGYMIQSGRHNFVVATDMGVITERADHYMRQANHLMIEANYDLRMLMDGMYPEYLKARIVASQGHMDNVATAEYLARIASPSLQHVFLCHLSHDNNTPQKALEAVASALAGAGKKVGDFSGAVETRDADIQLMALPRFDSTGSIILRLK